MFRIRHGDDGNGSATEIGHLRMGSRSTDAVKPVFAIAITTTTPKGKDGLLQQEITVEFGLQIRSIR